MADHSPKTAAHTANEAPLCPGCGKPMQSMRLSPNPDGNAMVHSFTCRACGVTSIEESTDPSTTSC
jgi:hypothetical protein